jgi:hypothetical protein
MNRRRLVFLFMVAAFLPAAYWGTKADAATSKPTVHCLVFRFAVIGNQAIALDKGPIGEVPCPRERTHKA